MTCSIIKCRITDSDYLKKITLKQINYYLISNGWGFDKQESTFASHSKKIVVDNALEDFYCYVPNNEDYSDYPRRVGELIEILAVADKHSQLCIISRMLNESIDIRCKDGLNINNINITAQLLNKFEDNH